MTPKQTRATLLQMWLLGVIVIFGPKAQAGPPEIVRVRVPAAKASSLFPPGADLRVLPIDQFENLVKQALRSSSIEPSPAPRLARARHLARWDAGLLTARSELAFARPGSNSTGLVILDPWTPAITGSGQGATLRATVQGLLAIQVEPGDSPSAVVDWKLRARNGSDGRVFSLGLPQVDASSLVLDLPSGMVPESDVGERVNPVPGSSPGRTLWTIEGFRGRTNLRLGGGTNQEQGGYWVNGTVQVDLGASPSNWRGEWSIVKPLGISGPLVLDLDSGLELIDVTGSRVKSFQATPQDSSTRVTVSLVEDGSATFSIVVRAIARVPSDGIWPIPAARFQSATWTGDRVSVRPDGGRVVDGCLDRQGRRVAPRLDDPFERHALVFEATSPGSVAELTFRRPIAETAVEVRGTLRLGRTPPRLDVSTTWSLEAGKVPELLLLLPSGWAAEAAQGPDGNPVRWHATPGPGGGTLIRFPPSVASDLSRPLVLGLTATAARLGTSGPMDLPRVRPTAQAVRVSDEIWTTILDPDLEARPTEVVGLAWMDPPAASPPVPSSATAKPDETSESLAWRWTGGEESSARIDRIWHRPSPHADWRQSVLLVGDRLQVDWVVHLESRGSTLVTIPIQGDFPSSVPLRWTTSEPSNPVVRAIPLDAAGRLEFGLPEGGQAWNLELARPVQGTIELRTRLDMPCVQRSEVPVLAVSERFRPTGLIAVNVETAAQVRVNSTGLDTIDATSSRFSEPAPLSGSMRRAALFVRRPGPATLQIEVQPGSAQVGGGVVREAILTSQIHAGTWSRHRLNLRVANDSASSIDFVLPVGSQLDRIRRDGLTITATPVGSAISIDLLPPTANRPTSSLTLDYRTANPDERSRLDAARFLPTCSFDCMSFVWELSLPSPWQVGETGAGLARVESKVELSWAQRWLGISSIFRDGATTKKSPERQAAMSHDLDAIVGGIAPGETTLGDFLIRLDAGARPLVVDRLALNAAGLGPKSRLDLEAASGSTLEILKSLGLSATPISNLVLISGPFQDHSQLESGTLDRVQQAAVAHCDASDRFQTAARFLGEATPRALSVGEAPESFATSTGWRTWRFVSAQWPDSGQCFVLCTSERRNAWIEWGTSAALLALAVLIRNFPSRIRATLFALIATGAGLALYIAFPEPSPLGLGLVRGGLAMLVWWVGLSHRIDASSIFLRVGGDRPSGRHSWSQTRAVVGIMLFLLAGSALAADPGAPSRILAVMPYDGPPDPESLPSRVLLLLSDFERLTGLARSGPPWVPPVTTLSAANHRLARAAGGRVNVESSYDLWVQGEGSTTWSLPVGSARDLVAEVDQQPTPLAINPEGSEAVVTLSGPGKHTIQFRRWLPLLSSGAEGDSIRLPINPAAFARVAVARSDQGLWVDLPGACGSVVLVDSGIEASLGPMGILEARWSPESRSPAAPLSGSIEAAYLWDIRPSGNLVRAQFVHDNPDGVSILRLELEPGTVVREGSVPNLVASRLEGTAERPEWVGFIDPPWARDVSIEVVGWSSIPAETGTRRLPRIIPRTSNQGAGSLVLRRPDDWSGQLTAKPNLDPWSEASAIKVWGTWPSDGLVPSGMVRFEGSVPATSLAAAPLPSRLSARTKVLLSPRAGRLDAIIDTLIVETQGHRAELEFSLPSGFQDVKVEADGLTSWRASDGQRTILRFDGSPHAERNIRISGFVAASADRPMAEIRAYQAVVPWPIWDQVSAEAGTLSLPATTRYPTTPDSGVTAVPASSTADTATGRQFYRVEKPELLVPLRWSSPAARVDVSIESDLALLPTSVEWTASVECNVSGGPAESLTWTLPSAWARQASVELLDQPHRLETVNEGSTTRWTIYPQRPIWGRSRLRLRSVQPLEPGKEFLFPDLAPFASPGRGKIERYALGIRNVSGHALEVAGSPGLREADVTRYRSEDSSVVPGVVDRAFLVSGERWSLRLVAGREGAGKTPAERNFVEVIQSRLICSLGANGEVSGRATFDLARRPAPFLAFRLPSEASVPWASVDGRIVAPVREGSDRWFIPIGERASRRVCLAWTTRAVGQTAKPDLLRPIALPALEQEDVPNLVLVSAPASIRVEGGTGRLIRVAGPTWDVEDAERLARSIGESLAELDRESSSSQESLIENLIAFELKARVIERAEPPRTPAEQVASETRRTRLQEARRLIVETAQATGLDHLLVEARVAVGLSAEGEETLFEPAMDPSEAIRVRRIGEVTYFRGFGPTASRPGGLMWRLDSASLGKDRRGAWINVVVSLVLAILGSQLLLATGRRHRKIVVVLAGCVLVALSIWALPLGIGLLALSVLAWFTG